MVNPFTAQAKVSKIQQDVLQPLYTMYSGQETAQFDWLLVETGRAISQHQQYIEEVCSSRMVAVIFKIIKLLGGADQLTEEDFARFTEYVKDGGIKAMVKMLLSVNKEEMFVDELKGLPHHIQQNAPLMLEKSKSLHTDFITEFFKESHGSVKKTPPKLQENFSKADNFMHNLARLAAENLQKG